MPPITTCSTTSHAIPYTFASWRNGTYCYRYSSNSNTNTSSTGNGNNNSKHNNEGCSDNHNNMSNMNNINNQNNQNNRNNLSDPESQANDPPNNTNCSKVELVEKLFMWQQQKRKT